MDLARLPSGEVVTLSWKLLESAILHAYSPNLELLWQTAVRPRAMGLLVRGDLLWVIEPDGISAYDRRGTCVRQVTCSVSPRMRVGGIAPFDGDFLVAMEHDVRPVVEPVMMRLDSQGAPRWMSTLPMENVAIESQSVGDAEARVVSASYSDASRHSVEPC